MKDVRYKNLSLATCDSHNLLTCNRTFYKMILSIYISFSVNLNWFLWNQVCKNHFISLNFKNFSIKILPNLSSTSNCWLKTYFNTHQFIIKINKSYMYTSKVSNSFYESFSEHLQILRCIWSYSNRPAGNIKSMWKFFSNIFLQF